MLILGSVLILRQRHSKIAYIRNFHNIPQEDLLAVNYQQRKDPFHLSQREGRKKGSSEHLRHQQAKILSVTGITQLGGPTLKFVFNRMVEGSIFFAKVSLFKCACISLGTSEQKNFSKCIVSQLFFILSPYPYQFMSVIKTNLIQYDFEYFMSSYLLASSKGFTKHCQASSSANLCGAHNDGHFTYLHQILVCYKNNTDRRVQRLIFGNSFMHLPFLNREVMHILSVISHFRPLWFTLTKKFFFFQLLTNMVSLM